MPDSGRAAPGPQGLPRRRPAPGPVAANAPVSRAPAHVFLLAVVIFIIYGSLFPFDFTSQPLPMERFYAEYDMFANRADAIDNFFLFVPLGIALHLSFRRFGTRLAAAILSVAVLAVGIQLVQLYLPSRTASLSDALWNTVGMGAGFLAASRVRSIFHAQLSVRAPGRDDFLVCLIVLWFFYESFPFVPTLDFGLLRAHIKSAVVAPPFELMRLCQHTLAATLAGIAIMRLGLLRRPVLGVVALGAVSIALEVLVAYGDLRRETLLGIVLGLAAGYQAVRRFRPHSHDFALAVALCAFLITVLTPYRGQALDPGFTLTPFSHLLWQGIVKDFPPSAFEALAIGALLWAGIAGPRRLRDRPLVWCAIVLLLLAVLEGVRVILAGYHGDTTALVMALILAPAAVAFRVRDMHEVAEPASAPVAVPVPPPVARRPPLALFAGSAAALTLGMWLLLQLPGIPYNLKKLFGDHALFGAAVFSLALLWIGSGPWLVARTVIRLEMKRKRGAVWAPLLLVGIALLSFVLVNTATPDIMLNKIIGAPDLYRRVVDENYWGAEWRDSFSAWPGGLVRALERVVRYVALYSVFMIPLVVGLLALARQDRRPRVLVNLLCLLPFWVLAKYVVLDWAVTDNLTELVADGGVWFLAVMIALFAGNAVALISLAGRPRKLPVLAVATVAMLGAGWWLLNQGLETAVVNNGRLFAGVQFLLGENRTELLSAPALFARWCALYAGALAVVATGALLALRAMPVPAAHRKINGTARTNARRAGE